ncbi:MAG: hypothetical protein HY901_32735, partial [Deltaproteobacteria bacterium]|nr:hypothetical protein [Deltaproteobacteria bacterium]
HRAKVLVYLPRGYSSQKRYRLLIALHGWGHAPEDFRQHTSLAAHADRQGLVLVLPEMGKTVYETRFYPETRGRWGAIPGARWIGEVVLPFARERFAVSKDKADTAILGYSTGGRGAVVVAQRYREFSRVISLSGTYALLELPAALGESKIHAAVFGDLVKHAERWRLDDGVRPDLRAALDGVQLVLAHGGQDKVVPPSQLEVMERFLGGERSGAKLSTRLEEKAGHDWPFWDRAMAWALEDW